LKKLRAILAEENVKDAEDGDGRDVGRLWDTRGLGEEGSGVTTRYELQVAIPGVIWDNGCGAWRR